MEAAKQWTERLMKRINTTPVPKDRGSTTFYNEIVAEEVAPLITRADLAERKLEIAVKALAGIDCSDHEATHWDDIARSALAEIEACK